MSVIVTNRRSIGVNFSSRGECEVLVWAPHASSVVVLKSGSGQRIKLHPEARGYFSCITPHLKPGDEYWIELDNEDVFPDPASILQPNGIAGPSEIFNPNAFQWTDNQWKNPPMREYIIYELHVGTFTHEGDFAGVVNKLPYLKELGVTAIELMPVAEFPGRRNWGYDGVFPYAAHHAYGGPRALQHMVNACHKAGIAVILDVVYNHLGPEGNNLEKFGPYFTDKYKTPWGKAINFDDAGCDEVRKFFIENALMWLRDFHIDALRLDAVHAIRDFGATHFLQELRSQVDLLSEKTERAHYLIAECDLNDPRYLDDQSKNGYGMDAQWIDEFHHALRVASGKEPLGYYSDFADLVHLGKAFADAYVFDGQYSEHRQKTFGRKTTGFSGDRFIVFSQNHDQIGNTMRGERTSKLVQFDMLKLLAGAVICSPYIPMLFMGEEYGEHQPFQYFVSHQGEELIQAVRTGRRNEFAAFFKENESVPDPQADQTFIDSKLRWESIDEERHGTLLRYYKELIRLRKASVVLHSASREKLTVEVHENERSLIVNREVDGHRMMAVLNFSTAIQSLVLPDGANMECLLDSTSRRFGGDRENDVQFAANIKIPPMAFILFSTEISNRELFSTEIHGNKNV